MPPITSFLTNSGSWGIICVVKLTVVAKLDLSVQDKERLNRTLEVFAAACNAISQAAFNQRCFNPVALHHLTYREIRQRFNLPANYTACAIRRVANAYKIIKSKKTTFETVEFQSSLSGFERKTFPIVLERR
jgi:predicted transposase